MRSKLVAALARLRDAGHARWSVAMLLALIVVAHTEKMGRGGWEMAPVAPGALVVESLSGMFFPLILRWSGFSALWIASGSGANLTDVVLHGEITLMFMLALLVVLDVPPAERARTIASIGSGYAIPDRFGPLRASVDRMLYAWGTRDRPRPHGHWPREVASSLAAVCVSGLCGSMARCCHTGVP